MAALIEAIEIKRKMFFEYEGAPYHTIDVEVSDLELIDATFQYSDSAGYHFMDQDTFDTVMLQPDVVGDDRLLLVDNVLVQVQKFNGLPIGLQFPPHIELTVTSTEPGVRGDTASGGVTKAATLETGLEIRVPLFIKEGEKVKVHTETREFAGRA
jgi:elongation factor P